jgi:hypothetical protein
LICSLLLALGDTSDNAAVAKLLSYTQEELVTLVLDLFGTKVQALLGMPKIDPTLLARYLPRTVTTTGNQQGIYGLIGTSGADIACYVGSTRGLYRRIWTHFNEIRRKGIKQYVYRILSSAKYTVQSVIFVCKDAVSPELLLLGETVVILLLDCVDPGQQTYLPPGGLTAIQELLQTLGLTTESVRLNKAIPLFHKTGYASRGLRRPRPDNCEECGEPSKDLMEWIKHGKFVCGRCKRNIPFTSLPDNDPRVSGNCSWCGKEAGRTMGKALRKRKDKYYCVGCIDNNFPQRRKDRHLPQTCSCENCPIKLEVRGNSRCFVRGKWYCPRCGAWAKRNPGKTFHKHLRTGGPGSRPKRR